MKKIIFLLTVCGFCLFACNPAIDIPSYIYVDSVTFTCQNSQGSISSKITDVRLTVNGDDRGSYDIPALIPVLASGKAKIQIQPVVFKNGLSQQRMVNYTYNLYDDYRQLKKGQVDTIRPQFTYSDLTQFYFIENFEDAGIKFSSTGAPVVKTTDDNLLLHVANDNSINHTAGMICFEKNDSNSLFELKTISPVYLTSTSMTVCFLELNYSGTQNIEVGAYFNDPSNNKSTQEVIAIVNATTQLKNWRKLYINLTEAINKADFNVTNFDLYIKGYSGGINQTDTFLLDNIKLIYI
ncbi:MAG: hypothetical protein J6Y47_04245 [Bacteroidales bacterium]|nr:hypothetical protein [Bacteroidales bacterium]